MSICEDEKRQQKEKNRQQFPRAAALLDEYREEFGEDVRLTFVEENGKTLGKPISGNFMTPDQWIRLSELIEFERKKRKKK